MPAELARIDRDDMLMQVAQLVAQRATCLRRQVGAVVARKGRIISTGYNGAPAGLPHCNVENCRFDLPCERTIHAEANAIAFAARYGVELGGSTLYTTDSPCKTCAGLIINSGIKEVFYGREYRDLEPVELLEEVGIKTMLLIPNAQS